VTKNLHDDVRSLGNLNANFWNTNESDKRTSNVLNAFSPVRVSKESKDVTDFLSN